MASKTIQWIFHNIVLLLLVTIIEVVAVAIIAVLLYVYAPTLFGQDPPKAQSLILTELERTKAQLIVEKQKSNSKTAALIHNAYDQNQAEGKALAEEATALHDQICQAHGLDPANCDFSADGLAVKPKNLSPAPAAKTKPSGQGEKR